MKRISAQSPSTRIALVLLLVSAASVTVAFSGPGWRNLPAPPAAPQRPTFRQFQQPVQPNVRPPHPLQAPFRGGAAAAPRPFRNPAGKQPIDQFLFGPAQRPGFKPPLVAALDLNGDNLISSEELAQAVNSLKQADANGDGNIGPAEWAPRFGKTANNFLSNNRERGTRPGRPTVGEGRPGTSAKSETKPEEIQPKKRKRERKNKRERQTKE